MRLVADGGELSAVAEIEKVNRTKGGSSRCVESEISCARFVFLFFFYVIYAG